MTTIECKCSGCMETENILANGWCEECFDQNCAEDENH